MNSQNALQLAKMQNSSQEARDHAFKMEAVKKNLMPPVDKEKKLREACEGFESIFIQKIWEQMRATIPESGFLKGREEKFWQSMYDQELAKTMTGAGGIGIADMMYEQLSRNLRAASKDTAAAVGGQPSGFAAEIAPAPLVAATAPSQPNTAASSAQAPGKQQNAAALAGLYSEVKQPDAPPDGLPNAAAPGAPAALSVAEADTDPAILAVLQQLRNDHRTHAPMGGPQAAASGGQGLGARPPLPQMQGDGLNQAPAQQGNPTYATTLTRPVHKPAAGKRTVLPRAATGQRVPVGQPVHRNLPAAAQQSQTPNQVVQANPAQSTSPASSPGPASVGYNPAATGIPMVGG